MKWPWSWNKEEQEPAPEDIENPAPVTPEDFEKVLGEYVKVEIAMSSALAVQQPAAAPQPVAVPDPEPVEDSDKEEEPNPVAATEEQQTEPPAEPLPVPTSAYPVPEAEPDAPVQQLPAEEPPEAAPETHDIPAQQAEDTPPAEPTPTPEEQPEPPLPPENEQLQNSDALVQLPVEAPTVPEAVQAQVPPAAQEQQIQLQVPLSFEFDTIFSTPLIPQSNQSLPPVAGADSTGVVCGHDLGSE